MMQKRYWFLVIACLIFVAGLYLVKQKTFVEVIQSTFKVSMPRFSCDGTSCSKQLVYIGDSDIQLNLSMTPDEMDIAFHKFVSKLHIACEDSHRLGNTLDGGWDICLIPPFRPHKPCLFYSFGINNDFSFDDAVSKNYGCTVRSFDPSMTQNDHQRSANVWFYKIGISGSDVVGQNGWKLKTLSSIMKLMNDSNKILDYLKMDVEDSEWSSLTSMLRSGILSKVKQFGVELHIGSWAKQSLYDKYQLLKGLEDQGFRRWYSVMNFYNLKMTKNGFRSCCYEIVYINKNYLG